MMKLNFCKVCFVFDTGISQKYYLNYLLRKNPDNVAFICKNFYALTNIKELNLYCHLSNQDENNTYAFINNKTKDQIIKEH